MPSVGRVLERLQVMVDGDTSAAKRELHDLSDESKGGSWIGKLGSGAAKAAGLMAVGIGVGAAAMGGLGLAAAANAEQSNIAFTSIMGDAGKAKAFLADLNHFAATTPFELPGLRNAASQLLAVGLESARVIPLMRAIGDSTSAMGTGAEGIDRAVRALTQMQVKGKVTGEEMLQLAEAGVPAWEALAHVLGVDVATAQARVTAGQVKVNDLMLGLETSSGPALQRVKGMMDQQSASALGMLSTFKDVASQGLGEMMAPALQAIKAQAPQITSVLSSTLAAIGPQVSSLMTGAVGFLADLLPAVAPLLGAVAAALGDTFKALGPALAQLGPPLLRVFEALLPVLPAMANGLAAIIPALIPLINGFARLLELIPPNVLAAIVAGFMLFGPITGILSALGAVLPIVGAGFTLMLGPVGLVIAAIAALAAAGYLIYRNWDTIAAFFGGVWDKITSAFSTGVEAVVGFFTGLPGRALDALKALPFLLGGLATDAIRGYLTVWWTIVTEAPKAIVELAPKLVGAWWDMQQWLYRTVWDGIQALVGLFFDLPGMLGGALGSAASWLVHVGKNLIVGLWNGVGAMWGGFWSYITGLPGEILRAFGDAGQWLVHVGKNVVIGLWNGLASMGSWLWDKVTGWIKDVLPTPIARALGMASPSKVMAYHGRMAGLGLVEGMLGTSGEVASAAGVLAKSARPSLSGSFATSSSVSAGAGAGAGGTPQVLVQIPSGAIIPLSDLGRRLRVLFLDDGGRNAFQAATG